MLVSIFKSKEVKETKQIRELCLGKNFGNDSWHQNLLKTNGSGAYYIPKTNTLPKKLWTRFKNSLISLRLNTSLEHNKIAPAQTDCKVVQLPRRAYSSIPTFVVAMEDNGQGRIFCPMETRALDNVGQGSSFQGTESKSNKYPPKLK